MQMTHKYTFSLRPSIKEAGCALGPTLLSAITNTSIQILSQSRLHFLSSKGGAAGWLSLVALLTV